MKTIGVTEEQARAFHLKLWTLHLDSQRKKSTKANGQQDPGLASSGPLSSNLSSRDISGFPDIPFTERIRPGMAVRWNPPADFPFRHEAQNLAVVLCPLGAAGRSSTDMMGRQIQQSVDENPAFLCALVLPGALGDSFEVHLWRQIAVPVQDMLSEVILEYDAATRYYHITV